MSFLGCAAWCHTHKPDSARRPEVLPRSRHYLADTVFELKYDEKYRQRTRNLLSRIVLGLAELDEFEWPADKGALDAALKELQDDHGLKIEYDHSTPVVTTPGCCRKRSRHSTRTDGVSHTLFVFVSLSVEQLVRFAGVHDSLMLLHSECIKTVDQQLNKLWLQDPVLRERFLLNKDTPNERPVDEKDLAIPDPHAYEFITIDASYFSEETAHLFYVYGHTKAVLSSSDALKTLVRTLSEAGVDLEHEVNSDKSPLVTWFPDDTADAAAHLKTKVKERWLSWRSTPWNQPLRKLRYYFGEKVTMYFAFLAHTTFWLVFPSIFGLFFAIRRYAEEGVSKRENTWTAVFGLFMSVWVTLFLEAWKRVQSRRAQEWGMQSFEKEEATRPQFLRKAKNGRSQVTGEAGVAESRCIQMFRRVVSYSVISTMVVMVLIAVFSMFVLRVWLVKKEPDEISEGWGDRSTAIINALQIQIMSRVYNWVARKLTDFENPRTQTEFEDSLITKTCLFQFVNNYVSLFYIAFLKKDVTILGSHQRCDDDDCLGELETQLATILLVRVFLGNFNELVVPRLKALAGRIKSCVMCVKEEHLVPEETSQRQHRLMQSEKKALLPPYDTFDDYLETLIMFGYASLFGVAFPLAPAIVLVNSFLEIHLDASKLFSTFQRPAPFGAQDIGSWYIFFAGIGYLGVLTNLGVSVFTNTNPFFGVSDTRDKLVAFVCVEHLLFALKFLIGYGIRDVPTAVTQRIERCSYLAKKHIKNKAKRALCSNCHRIMERLTPAQPSPRRRLQSLPGHRMTALAAAARSDVGAGAGAGAGAGVGAGSSARRSSGTEVGQSDVAIEMAPLSRSGSGANPDVGPITNPMRTVSGSQ